MVDAPIEPLVLRPEKWTREVWEAVRLVVSKLGGKIILPVAEQVAPLELAKFNEELVRHGIRVRRKARWDLGNGVPGREELVFAPVGVE